MSGVEDIKHPLQSLSFLPIIHGKGNKTETSCTVVPDRSREGKKCHSNTGTNQRMPLPEYIKQEYSNHRKEGVVRRNYKTETAATTNTPSAVFPADKCFPSGSSLPKIRSYSINAMTARKKDSMIF